MPSPEDVAQAFDAAEKFADAKANEFYKYAREQGIRRWWEDKADSYQHQATLIRQFAIDQLEKQVA